jgi:hypothetical protein
VEEEAEEGEEEEGEAVMGGSALLHCKHFQIILILISSLVVRFLEIVPLMSVNQIRIAYMRVNGASVTVCLR